MARNHGRISTAIWGDEDFIALPPGPQRMYMFLLAQSNLSHAGLLPLTMNRWASKAAAMTAASVKADLQALAAARFVVVDAAAEELLIRTFVKGDNVYKQPNIMRRLPEDAEEITSPKLRAALLAELDRLPLHELSDAPTAKGDRRSARQVALDSIQAVRQVYGIPSGSPYPDPSGWVPGTHTETLPGTHDGTPADGFPEGMPNGSGKGSSRTHTRIPPSPIPHPPIPPTAAHAENGERAADQDESPGAEVIPIGAITAQTLLAEWIDYHPGPPPDRVKGQVAKYLGAMLKQGIAPLMVRAGLAEWHRACGERQGGVNPSALPSFVQAAQVAGTTASGRRRSTTDDRVAAGLALAERFEALDAQGGPA